MSNVLSEEKKQQVIALGKLGWPLRRIEQFTGWRQEPAGASLKAAGIGVRPPGAWGRRAPANPANEVITDPADSKPANEVTTDFSPPISPPTGNQDRVASACEPFREWIEQGLGRGRNAMAIWQDLVSDRGFPHGYQTVKRFVHKLRGSTEPQAVGRIQTIAGEEAQVDYRSGPMLRDAQSGKYRRTRLFVLTLGYSRKSARVLIWRSPSPAWADLHERAFRRLGGCPRLVVLDNLREGVLVADIYDPTLNPLFRDVLAHYGVVAMPCRIKDPDRKGKVEAGVGHAQKTPLKGLRFESLEEAQAYLDRWEERWADTRIHGTTKRQVAVMFAEEKPSLLPLPLEPFRYYQYGKRVVHLDGCVEVEAAYYGLPPGWIGRSVKVQWDALHVRILHPGTNQLLREHIRQKRGRYRIKNEYYPKKMPFSTTQLLRRAGHAGTQVGVLCVAIYQRQGEAGISRILGVLSPAGKVGSGGIRDALGSAPEIRVPGHTLLRPLLWRPPPPLSLHTGTPF